MGYHPDSNHFWTLGPNPAAFLETTVQAMELRKNQDQRCWDPQIEDQEVSKTQIKEVKPVVSKEEEVSASLSGREPEKGNIGKSEVSSVEKPTAETTAINGEERAMVWTKTMTDAITGTADISPQLDSPMLMRN